MCRPAFTFPIVAAGFIAAPFLAMAQSASPPPETTVAKPVAPVERPAAAPKPAASRPASTRPAARSARGAAPSRDGIEALEVRLDAAADRVSAPQLLSMLGRPGTARGYRLPGYGIVVVLTPRALPGTDVFKVMRPGHGVRVDSHRPGAVATWVEAPELDALERQVVILQHESEATRRAAEETQQKIVETVRYRFAAPGEMTVEVGPEPPAPAEPPAPPVPPAPANPPEAMPAPAQAPPAPPPPWKFWFSEGPHDERTKDAVVADVRSALVEAITSHPGRVVGLGPEEFVAVVVDFEDAGRIARRPRPERTLVVRARVRDMEARSSGAISPEELRRRLEVLEY